LATNIKTTAFTDKINQGREIRNGGLFIVATADG
jgi:hypothetical protein